jgi:hypothetical protein
MQGKLIGAGLACAVLLAGCGDINVKKYLPFGGDRSRNARARRPTPRNTSVPPASAFMCAPWKAARRCG